jgi:hypothetical protein
MKTEEDTSEMTMPTIIIGHRTTEIAKGEELQQCKTSKHITIMGIETDIILSTITEAGAMIGVCITRIHHEDPS